jgi:amidohydrolase
MPVINRIAEFHTEMTQWRHQIHAHPETAFEEHKTAELVAGLLKSFGISVDRGLAQTGSSARSKVRCPAIVRSRFAPIWMRCTSKNKTMFRISRHRGRMHACGHDGHTAMLLGAAKHLAETRNFAGTTHFIFQPAEENEGGARLMIKEGVLERYPIEAVFGMHNWPEVPAGQFAVRSGPMMAAFDIFEITISGRGALAAMPHLAIDPIVVAAQLVNALQTIASRNVNPAESAVVNITQIHGGDTWNVIPETVVLRGTTRSFNPAVRDQIERAIRRTAEGVCQACGANMELRYERRYPALINASAETEIAAATAASLVGESNVKRDPLPSMAAEDFACFLEQKPGAYIWIGNGTAEAGGILHNPHYDFNDEVLPLGASYWVRLAESVLAKERVAG